MVSFPCMKGQGVFWGQWLRYLFFFWKKQSCLREAVNIMSAWDSKSWDPPTIQLCGLKSPTIGFVVWISSPWIYNPRHSMYGIITYIWLVYMANVGKDTIHWVSGNQNLFQENRSSRRNEECVKIEAISLFESMKPKKTGCWKKTHATLLTAKFSGRDLGEDVQFDENRFCLDG